ncbi:hypothetical protein NUW58_g5499 [Xylaria curta]|uniref:Uncharacterized protein n=1 Tax=Xylaria curta TaxID=42375 RepID=A0ACC1P195_9PEZI|nr:hypothetical protein NUW58_g5499 [Xylaria curta]
MRGPTRQDDSSGSESHGDDHGDAATFDPPLNDASPDSDTVPVPIPAVPLQGEQPDDWYNELSNNNRQRTGENIVTLLFRVSEDNARRNAYVHRGCLCNGCGMLPIRGIRYRCANCPDFDLCEMCESQGSHNKAHVFYKVKVPVPSSAARHVQPPWYPGDPNSAAPSLPRHLLAKWSHETGFERVELDALWEQWTFMANTEWRDDPNQLGLAMDRRTFERCLVPSAGYRHPAPNLIHDRMFAFYDTNHDDLIGFEEYLHGVSYKRRKDKLKRTFDGYDVDGDGYVSRRDFLRMFRAYYVSYKQMHRDTVEGLDDYMMTNVEVQQLVNSRQPISSLFGRDQRIPDAESARHMEGKVFRSGGDVEVVDGRGAVGEDKPDASSREDILRDLFTRNSNHSLFTESFGSSSRRPPSPTRDTQYWAGILNPPRSTVDLAALLSGNHAQLDEILDSIRHQGPRVLLSDDDDESGSSDDDYPSNPYDLLDEVGGVSYRSIDDSGNIATSPGLPDPREFLNVLPTENQLQPERETFTSPQQLNFEKRKRVIARRQLYERWKRRQFYLDEEEGALPPQGWREEQDILAHANDTTESSKSVPPHLSPRSRSSSKVRFAWDTDDMETRSTPSTSSRSVAERWGGMEIPDAERDAGKEILYQITQQAFNELLDALFKKKEDLAVLAAETKTQRDKYRQLLDDFDPQDEDEKSTKESPEQPASRQSPVRRPIQQQSLHELLSTSGYSVLNPGTTEEGRSHEASDNESRNVRQETQTDQTRSCPPAAAPPPDNSTSAAPEYRDPTMPQFMPNSAPVEADWIAITHESERKDQGEALTSVPEPSKQSTSDLGTPSISEPHITRPDTPCHIPRSTLAMWKVLDEAEQEAKKRGGWGRLSYAEFEEIYRDHEFQEAVEATPSPPFLTSPTRSAPRSYNERSPRQPRYLSTHSDQNAIRRAELMPPQGKVEIIEAREIDTIGTDGIIKKIIDRVGTEKPVYLSLDIDTLDPAFAPATGTPETGGWSTRELRTILRGLENVNLIAADIVEVAPAYDTNAEHTTMAAADALYEIMSVMLKKGPLSNMVAGEGDGEL